MRKQTKRGVSNSRGLRVFGGFLMCLLLLTASSRAGEVDVSAVLKRDGEVLVSTPKVGLYPGMEAVRLAVVEVEGQSYVFALKSSVLKEKGKMRYAVAVSLEQPGNERYSKYAKGIVEKDKSTNFNIEKDGKKYTAVVLFSET